MGNKSYNPFKMWGSYAGLIIALIISILNRGLDLLDMCKDYAYLNCLFSVLIFTPIIGFLIGYGIHSLFRRFRK